MNWHSALQISRRACRRARSRQDRAAAGALSRVLKTEPRARRLGVAALALLGLGAALPGAASATFPGSTGDVVSGNRLLDPFDPASKPRQVSPNSEGFSASRWSPDGTKIAYQADGPRHAIWVINADGTGARQMTKPGQRDFDSDPAWSADGSEIFFVRSHGTDDYLIEAQLRRTSAETGGDGVEIGSRRGRFNNIEAQPGGRTVVVEFHEPGAIKHSVQLLSFDRDSSSGYQLHKYRADSPLVDHFDHGRRLSWSPDGKRLAFVEGPYAEGRGRKILILDPQGQKLSELALSDGKRIGGLTFTPDGAHLLVGACGAIEHERRDDRCTQRLLLAAPEDADVDPEEPRETALPGPGPEYGADFQVDFQPADHPVILVPGFMGTEMDCPEGRVWPLQLSDLRLNDAGTGNAKGTCGAQPSRLFESFWTEDIYGSLKQKLKELLTDPNDPRTKNRVYPFVWDWRLDPRPQLGELDRLVTTALADELSTKQGLDEVIMVGHSAGGLVIRAALNNAALLKRVRRVLTIGTPYLGTPRALFSLLAGMQEPGVRLARLLDPSMVQRVSRNLTGGFIQYPSANYGPWLRAKGSSKELGPEATFDYLRSLKASPRALARAFDFKSSISGFKRLEPTGLREFRVLAGSGRPTIGRINLIGGGEEAGVTYATGDQTVPLSSATQTPPGERKALGDTVGLSHVCNIEHLRLAQDPKVFELIGDFIRYGSPPQRTRPCTFSGVEYEVREVGGTRASAARARRVRTPVGTRALRRLQKAERRGVLNVIALRGETKIVTGRGYKGRATIPVRRALISATPIRSAGRGRTLTYGPLTGRLQLRPQRKTGKVSLKLNGRRVKPRRRPHGRRRSERRRGDARHAAAARTPTRRRARRLTATASFTPTGTHPVSTTKRIRASR